MSATAETTPDKRGRRTGLNRALHSGGLVLGLAIVLVLILAAIAAPWAAPFDPDDQDVLLILTAPDALHWFGTDAFGRDVFSRVMWGARVSLYVGFVATALGIVVGSAIGLAAGFYGGLIDRLVGAVTDILLSFPQLIMGLLLVAVLGASLTNLIIAIAVTAVPAFIRMARGSAMAMRERDFVDACRALGYSDLRIMAVHILPNSLDELVVMASLWLASAIRTESTLAFIGLSVPPPTATWGGIVREGFDNLLDAPWLALFPSLAILAVMIGLNMIGDGLRDASDPRAPQ